MYALVFISLHPLFSGGLNLATPRIWGHFQSPACVSELHEHNTSAAGGQQIRGHWGSKLRLLPRTAWPFAGSSRPAAKGLLCSKAWLLWRWNGGGIGSLSWLQMCSRSTATVHRRIRVLAQQQTALKMRHLAAARLKAVASRRVLRDARRVADNRGYPARQCSAFLRIALRRAGEKRTQQPLAFLCARLLLPPSGNVFPTRPSCKPAGALELQST